MKKTSLRIISFLIVICTVVGLVSCGKKPETPVTEDLTEQTSKSQTQPIQIVDIPTEKAELADMFNAALEYVELYCYHYTKNTVCNVSNLSVGDLSVVSNANDAFRSIFGKKDVSYEYDYNNSHETFKTNFPESGYSVNDIQNITAEQKDENIIITATFAGESNPTDEKGNLHKLCSDYLSAEDVKKALNEFSSSAESVTASASDITVKATLNAKDSSLETLEISFTQRYSLSGVTLVKMQGSAVTATSSTVITYTDIGI